MVSTRSGIQTVKNSPIKKTSKIQKKKFKLVEIKKNDDDIDDLTQSDSDDSSQIEDEFLEEYYEAPNDLQKDKKLTEYYDSLVKNIKANEPTLNLILKSKIRKKRKLDLIQEFFIFKFSYPYSEERFIMKKQIIQKLKYYKKEYIQFVNNRKNFMQLENLEKNEFDIMDLKSKLLNLKTSEKNIQILFQKFNSLEAKGNMDDEYYKALNWLKLCLKLPFDSIKSIPYQSDISAFLVQIKNELDRELYGMTHVKEQLLLYIHNRIMNPLTQNSPLCLIGKPGIGKTSIALVISKVLQLPFSQISMGGVTNSEFLLGFDSCYVGSKPGRIANALIQSKCKNCVLFFDEFDKCTENKDIVNSMLHITDPIQNRSFRDNFFGDISIDISNCFFIMSMNEKPIDKALDDRLFYIHLTEYSEKEKFNIVKNYLLPKCLKNLNISLTDMLIDDDTIKYFVQKISPGSSGIRTLKQNLNDIVSKLMFLINNQSLETSFSLQRYQNSILKLPVTIDKYIIDQLSHKNEEKISTSILHMYI